MRRARRRSKSRARRPQPARGRIAPRPVFAPLQDRPSGPPPSADPQLVEGVALFNHREFAACRQALEAAQAKSRGRSREFYQGLIEAAVACSHWVRGNPGGAVSLYRSSSRRLRKYRPAFLGVNVERFLERSGELFGWLRRHRLRYDAHLIPTIGWATSLRPTPVDSA